MAVGLPGLKLPFGQSATWFSDDKFLKGVEFMAGAIKKGWLGATLLLCLVPSSFALQRDGDHPGKCKPGDNCQQKVPEGGSAAIYLLGAGLTCLGAVFLRSRSSKLNLS